MRPNKHTPGPWTNNGYSAKDFVFDVATEDNKKLIAKVSIFSGEPETKEAQANAALIAAAPEMFEALEKINQSLLEKHKGNENHTYELLLISDALEKARGES